MHHHRQASFYIFNIGEKKSISLFKNTWESARSWQIMRLVPALGVGGGVEEGGSSLRLAWSIEQVPGQLGLHRNPCLEKLKGKGKGKKKLHRKTKQVLLISIVS